MAKPKRWPLALIWLGLWVVAPVVLTRMAWAIITKNTARAWLIAISFDDLGNVGGNGRLGQSISSRAAHARPKLWARCLCWVLNKINPGHCDRAMTAKDQNLQ